jgi:hypothetical protein
LDGPWSWRSASNTTESRFGAINRVAPNQDHAKCKSKARIESDTAAIAYQTGATVISNYAVIS